MGSVLPLVGIAALMVVGLVILMTALTYDPSAKQARTRDPASAWKRRSQRKQMQSRAARALSARRTAPRELAVALRTRAVADAWWPRFHHHARGARIRWLTLESTTGQLIAGAAMSVVAAWLVVTFTG
jgi:hypothetical protein